MRSSEYGPKRTEPKKGLMTHSPADVTNLKADVLIYADGGCRPNPGPSGSGVALYQEKTLRELWYGLHSPQGTNNTAELHALHHALMIAEQEIAKGNSVTVLSDSQYSIQAITKWAKGWKRRGWKLRDNSPVKNLEIIQPLYSLYEKIKESVDVVHINGHVGIEGNELADRMSFLAISEREEEWRAYSLPIVIDEILNVFLVLS